MSGNTALNMKGSGPSIGERKTSSTSGFHKRNQGFYKRNCGGFIHIHKTPDTRLQIKAGKQELMRRIKCFQALKRQEVSDNNIQEFCIESHYSQKNWKAVGCARVDSAILPLPGCKTHIKVHRVVNDTGPQDPDFNPTSGLISVSDPPVPIVKKEENTGSTCQKCNSAMPDQCPFPIADRLASAESYLDMSGPVPRDVYERIKQIENRILRLEGISPEYTEGSVTLRSKWESNIPEDVIFESEWNNGVKKKKKKKKIKNEFAYPSLHPDEPKQSYSKEELEKRLLDLKSALTKPVEIKKKVKPKKSKKKK